MERFDFPPISDVLTLAASKHHSYSPDRALASWGISQNFGDNQSRKGRLCCDHCKKPGHFKGTCWKLHEKPYDLKLNRDRKSRGNAAITETFRSNNAVPFTIDQLELLQHLSIRLMSQLIQYLLILGIVQCMARVTLRSMWPNQAPFRG